MRPAPGAAFGMPHKPDAAGSLLVARGWAGRRDNASGYLVFREIAGRRVDSLADDPVCGEDDLAFHGTGSEKFQSLPCFEKRERAVD